MRSMPLEATFVSGEGLLFPNRIALPLFFGEVRERERRRIEDRHALILRHPGLAVAGKAREELREGFGNRGGDVVLVPCASPGEDLFHLNSGVAPDFVVVRSRELADFFEKPLRSSAPARSLCIAFLKNNDIRMVA
jgi:hypothetical protein